MQPLSTCGNINGLVVHWNRSQDRSEFVVGIHFVCRIANELPYYTAHIHLVSDDPKIYPRNSEMANHKVKYTPLKQL